jgi:hypothetical protein
MEQETAPFLLEVIWKGKDEDVTVVVMTVIAMHQIVTNAITMCALNVIVVD